MRLPIGNRFTGLVNFPTRTGTNTIDVIHLFAFLNIIYLHLPC